MRTPLIIIAILLPYFAIAQSDQDKYAIYSQYLREYQSEKAKKVHFVVRESTCNSDKYDMAEITNVVNELRSYLNGDAIAISDVTFTYKAFADTLKKDTMWMPLIAELGRKMKYKSVLENKFSKDLNIATISDSKYKGYFNKNKSLEKGWAQFRSRYPKLTYLVGFSEIVGDGTRAVFYFEAKCGGLCGQGYLVFCYKENDRWKIIPTLPLWQS